MKKKKLFTIASLNKFISRTIYLQVLYSQLKIRKLKTNLIYCQLEAGDLKSPLATNVVEQDVLLTSQLIF